MKNKNRKDAKAPQTTSKKSWIRGFGDGRLRKLLAERGKSNERTYEFTDSVWVESLCRHVRVLAERRE